MFLHKPLKSSNTASLLHINICLLVLESSDYVTLLQLWKWELHASSLYQALVNMKNMWNKEMLSQINSELAVWFLFTQAS